jgi:hypothetical protein
MNRTLRLSAIAIAQLMTAGCVGCGAPLDRYYVAEGEDIRPVISGRWDWQDADEACGADAGTYSFPADEMTMMIMYERPSAVVGGEATDSVTYDLLEVTRNYARGRIRGETRLTAAGDAVIWDLTLLSRDSFCWHRTDWGPDECTDELIRCPDRVQN